MRRATQTAETVAPDCQVQILPEIVECDVGRWEGKLIKNARMDQDGYVLFSGIVIRAIKAGHDYVEVGVANRDTNSKALRFSNFCEVLVGMAALFWEVRIRDRNAQGHSPIQELRTGPQMQSRATMTSGEVVVPERSRVPVAY